MIKKFAIALLIAPAVQSYQLYLDTDFFGGDMYPIENVNSSLKCMNYCEEIRNCKLATWCDPICFIKDTRTNKSEKLGCVSFDMFPEPDFKSGSGSQINETLTDPASTPTSAPTQTPTEAPTSTPQPQSTEAKSSSNKLAGTSAALTFILAVLL
jgi:hypothetical protein